MRLLVRTVLAVGFGLVLVGAAPDARADDTRPTRDIQAAVDAYLTSAPREGSLVGGPGSAGYDRGFWVRGGEPWLRINFTLQARYEWFDTENDEEGVPVDPGASLLTQDLAGFSLPRATLKFSGKAPCRMRYYVEFELGHYGGENRLPYQPIRLTDVQVLPWSIQPQSNEFELLREAWLEWGASDALNVRMGLVKTPNTRQMMVPPELQLFVDVSMASAVTGILMPGYTDRNRDYGVLVNGEFGGSREFQYMLSITNGDGGDSVRNVKDYETSDNLAYGGRLNWAFLRPIGYEEGGIGQRPGTWYGEIGAWGFYYADRADRSPLFADSHGTIFDRLVVGADAALGLGGWTFTGAFTYVELKNSDVPVVDDESWWIWFVQSGFRFPRSGIEVAARWSAYRRTVKGAAGSGVDAEPMSNTLAIAINVYLSGHSSKVQFDATYVGASRSDPIGAGYADVYSGVPLGWSAGGGNVLVRLQWQLAL